MTPAELIGRQLRALAGSAGPFVAAVSGGADSTALARLLHAHELEFHIASFDHRLRPDSAADLEFVRELAAELGVPFHPGSADVREIAARRGWNLDDAARRLRYSFLTRTARAAGASHILTAHTLDDQAETVLMQLLRGSAWLRGMPARRGRILRPLLHVERSSLTGWLTEHGHTWREDPTNLDTRLLRAWLRHELIPRLQERVPDLRVKLARLADLQTDQADQLRGTAGRLISGTGADTARLLGSHVAVQRQALADLLEQAGTAPDYARVERIRRQLHSPAPWRETLAPDRAIRVAYGRVELTGPEPDPPAEQPVTEREQLPAGIRAAALELPELRLRPRRPGDRMTLPGGSKSLARIMIDRKIPREKRDSLTVLASGSTIIWAEAVGPAAGWGVAGPADADTRYMELALAQAERAAGEGELPVGAVLVLDGRVLAEAHNSTETDSDPSAHAELLCLRSAARRQGDWRLPGTTLYVTLEPCAMCFGALLQAHVAEVVFAAPNHREGALGGVANLNREPWKRSLTVREGPGRTRAAALLSSFFSRKRGKGG